LYSTALENIKFSPQQSEILADWRPSIFQIIPTLIGSGLTLFVFNILVADINQPHVFLDVQQYDANINSNSNKSNYNNQIKFHNVAINDGRSPATNLRLSISYPNDNITNYRTSFQSENATFSYINNTLLVELKRLSSGSVLAIDTIARCINNYTSPVLASTTTVQTCAPNYVVTASYDQGSTFKSNIESPVLTASTFLNAHIRNQVIILATTFAIASFVIAFSLKRIRRFKRRLELSIFVFNILKEIVYIRDHLQQNVLSQKIFHLEPWLSKDQDDRRHVFDDYADYKLIDNFYKKLKERDNDLSDKNIDHEELKRYNNECLAEATNTIEKINWTDYQDLEDRKYYYPLTIMITAPCALIVFFAFEAYKVPFVLFLLGLPSQYHVVVYYIFTVFARTLVSFILAREIINFQTSFSYEIGVDNNFLSYYTLSRKEQIKLLVLSFVIVGAPILSVLHGFQFAIREFDFPIFGEIVVGVLVDVMRFFILVFLVLKFTMKRQLQMKMH
jgi:hypothetical protein